MNTFWGSGQDSAYHLHGVTTWLASPPLVGRHALVKACENHNGLPESHNYLNSSGREDVGLQGWKHLLLPKATTDPCRSSVKEVHGALMQGELKFGLSEALYTEGVERSC